MTDTESQSVNKGRYPWEFWLVIIMLAALLALILVVLLPQVPQLDVSKFPGDVKPTVKDAIDYNAGMLAHRKDVLAIIITAFGAWVGAGAAYFFGRENMRVATDGLLAMRESPRERLRHTSIKQILPTPLEWTVKKTDTIDSVKTKLTDKPELWFVPIIKDDGSLENVINEEAVWRYLVANATAITPTTTVDELITFIDATPALKRFSQIHVTVTMDTTVGAANDLMDSKQVFLAIVETEGKPTHFFTTTEVRKLLLQS